MNKRSLARDKNNIRYVVSPPEIKSTLDKNIFFKPNLQVIFTGLASNRLDIIYTFNMICRCCRSAMEIQMKTQVQASNVLSMPSSLRMTKTMKITQNMT